MELAKSSETSSANLIHTPYKTPITKNISQVTVNASRKENFSSSSRN
jgi:hypothetical protein